MKEELLRTVDFGQSLGAEYVEVRAQQLFKTFLTTKDGRVEGAKTGIESGAGVRVLVKGAWGFASLGKLEVKLPKEAVADAVKLAGAASLRVKKPVKLVDAKAIEDGVMTEPKRNPRDVPIQEKIDVALAMDKTVFGFDSRIKSCTIDYVDVTGTNHFVNSDGTFIEQDKLHIWSRIQASAREESIFASGRDRQHLRLRNLQYGNCRKSGNRPRQKNHQTA